MTDSKLDHLVKDGCIKSYTYDLLNTYGKVIDKSSDNRETERLVICFLNGQKLTIDTTCSGSSQNTSLCFE